MSPSGLRNSSNVCYMNGIIQAAASSQELIKRFKKSKGNLSDSSRLKLFLTVLKSVNKSSGEGDKIEENTKNLEALIQSVGWNKSSQQDAFDLLAALMKGIYKELKDKNYQIPMKTKLVHRFYNMNINDKCQDHLGLSVGLFGDYDKKPGVKLEDLIRGHFERTIIDDDPNKGTQLFFFNKAPKILLLHIQANKWDDERCEMVKPEYYITYDKEMTLICPIIKELGKEKVTEMECVYKLKAVVKHMGNISGGHYVTYRTYQEKWYLTSDEQIEETNFDNKIVPYIMIYKRKKKRKEKKRVFIIKQ